MTTPTGNLATDGSRPSDVPAMSLRGPLLLAALIVLVEVLASAWGWTAIPEATRIPIHWSASGHPNRWVSKETGLVLLPLMTIGLTALLAFLPRFEPRRTNLIRSKTAYRNVLVALLLLMGALHVVVILSAGGAAIDVGRVIFAGVGLLFVVIGNYLPKVRSNFMFGVRTPWTLASDRSWDLTHRLVGRLWFALGIAIALLAILGIHWPTAGGVLLAGILGTAVVAFVYSYRVWASDPDRQVVGSRGAGR